ncbi:antitoxin MazE family protein [Rheinheimera nanhaiensis]|uniref:antitoxin MazE family protein n=1 Tax=Rheinheimera nanhaiensis TaxID=1163621 RepID=UPI00058CAF33|nr:antitoxin MazE family protein [Rheinheimera nanhaiensis]
MPSIATRVKQHRDRLRRAGLRPIQIWVPDTRAEGFLAECRKQSLLVASADKDDAELMEIMENALTDIEGWE